MKKLTVILLVLAVLIVAVSCGKKAATTTTPAATTTTTTTAAAPAATEAPKATKPDTYVRADDEAVFGSILGDYEAMMDKAAAEKNDSKRFVLYAQAEAMLLDSAVMIQTTTQG